MIKIRTEISEIKHGVVGERKKVNETKNCFFEGIDKIDIPLLKLIRKNKTQIKNIKIESGDITTYSSKCKKTLQTTLCQ